MTHNTLSLAYSLTSLLVMAVCSSDDVAAVALSFVLVCGATVHFVAHTVAWRRYRRACALRVHRQLFTLPYLRAIERVEAGTPSAMRLEWTRDMNGKRGLHPFRYVIATMDEVDHHQAGQPRLKFLAYGLGDFA